jgi:chromosome segregation ATPase
MSLEETEINVGGTKFKGAHIAVVLAFVSTISGGIWATSEFFSRVGVLEDTVAEMQANIPDLAPLEVELEAIKTKIEDNDLGHLQGKLAELSTLLTTIQARQQEVLDNAATSNTKVATMEKDWIEVRNEYKKMADAIKGFEDSVGKFKREVDDLWKGLDAAASPLG